MIFFQIFADFFVFILFLMSQIQKSSPNLDPVKFGLDPDPGPQGLRRTSDTKSIETKKKTFKIIQNIHLIVFKIASIVRGTEPWIRIWPKPDPHHWILKYKKVWTLKQQTSRGRQEWIFCSQLFRLPPADQLFYVIVSYIPRRCKEPYIKHYYISIILHKL